MIEGYENANGSDAYLTIDAQDEWTDENYMDKATDLFKGSTSPVNQSVAVEVRLTNQTVTTKQYITLPTEIDQDIQQPKTPEIICELECTPTETTSITECECQIIGDPRSQCQSQYPLICTSKGYPSPDCICPSESVTQGYTKTQCEKDKFCSVITSQTIEECSCVDDDPRSQCAPPSPPDVCISKGQPTLDCICPSESVIEGYTKVLCEYDKLYQTSCIPEITTPVNECGCLALNDPRAQCQKLCVPTVETPVSQCQCLAINDPRQACKKACVPTIGTSIEDCACLAINDPRQVCQKACIPTSETPISQCGCLEINDPRQACKKA
ncbi:MAG: hypothetical protein EZS28_029798, partial [Streblomastix strix]